MANKGYMQRHKVRRGLTGWAQIHGVRGETDSVDKMKARIDHDLDYLRNWSLRLDKYLSNTCRPEVGRSRAQSLAA